MTCKVSSGTLNLYSLTHNCIIWTHINGFVFSPFPETDISFSTLFCRAVDVGISRWTFRLRDFPQDLLEIEDLHVSGQLIGAEPVGIDRGRLDACVLC